MVDSGRLGAARCVAVAMLALLAVACGKDRHESVATGDVATGSEGVTSADVALRKAMADSTLWPSYGRDYTNQRFSPLAQITTANVPGLRLAWVNHSKIPHASESNPVYVDGTIYLSTALNNVLAIDAGTGRTKWRYVHHYNTTTDCCAAINRGVTVYGGRVYMGTVDARLVALDAKTGHVDWDVQVGDNDVGYHITGTPLAAKGLIITGISGGEQGCRCYVTAYDAATGKERWRWYTIPSPKEGGWWGKWRQTDDWGMSFHRDIAQEKADSAKYADAWQHGGGPVWQNPAYDPDLGLIFVNIGNAAPDNDGSVRPGDNLYTSSVVALDLETGKLKWYFQEVSHDRWDYDATTPPVLVDVRDSTGRVTKAVAEAGKDGFVYVLDRATGKPLVKSASFVPQLNYMQPPTKQGVLINPATLGGSDWSPTAYDPATGWLYVDGNFLPQLYKVKHEPLQAPAQWWGGVVVAPHSGAYGIVSAVDLATGKLAWQTKMDSPLISGLLATRGGVVFTGTSGKKFVALDARTGKQLWSYSADAGVNAPPITYELNGTQYVVVAATGIQTLDSPRGDELLAFTLPKPGGTAALGAPTESPPDTGSAKRAGTARGADSAKTTDSAQATDSTARRRSPAHAGGAKAKHPDTTAHGR